MWKQNTSPHILIQKSVHCVSDSSSSELITFSTPLIVKRKEVDSWLAPNLPWKIESFSHYLIPMNCIADIVLSHCLLLHTVWNSGYFKWILFKHYSYRFQVIEEFIVAYQNVYCSSVLVFSSEITYDKNTDFCWTLVVVIVEGHLTWRSSYMSVLIVKPVRSPTSELSSVQLRFCPTNYC